MTTTAGFRPVPRAAFVVQKKSKLTRSVRVRQSSSNELDHDSDSDSTPSRTMRRGRRHVEQPASFPASRQARALRRRQVIAPAPEPEEEDEDDEDDEEEEEEDGPEEEEDESEDSSESSESSDSDIDGDATSESDSDPEEIDSDEEAETTQPPGASSSIPASSATNPGFQTLVPGAPSESSQPSEAALEEVLSSSSAQIIQTTTASESRPTETVADSTETVINEPPIPDSDGTSRIIEATSTLSNDLAGSTGDAATGDAAQSSQISDGDSGGGRGADVGIVLGTLAIAALLIVAGIFFFRKRRRSNQDHLERLPDEKSLPPDPPTFRLSAPPPVRVQRTQSSIMDEAIGAAYQNDFNQGYEQNNFNRDFRPASYEEDTAKNGISVAAAPVAPVSPVSPGANNNNNNNNQNLSPRWAPASPGNQQPMANFQLYPAPSAPPMVPPPPPAAYSNQNPDQYGPPPGVPPGGFRFPGQPRLSMAQTDTTEGEGTWSTFAVERMRANGGKLPLKERVLGHF